MDPTMGTMLFSSSCPAGTGGCSDQAQGCRQTDVNMVVVPTKMILDTVLGNLQLPLAEYKLYKNHYNSDLATAEFYVDHTRLHSPSARVCIVRDPASGTDSAIQNAAAAALTFLEEFKGIEVVDYNHQKTKILQCDNILLSDKLKQKDESMKQLSRGFNSTVDNMSRIHDDMEEIVQKNFSPNISGNDVDLNYALIEVDSLVTSLDQLVLQSTEHLQTYGDYPYSDKEDSLCTEERDSMLPCDYDSEVEGYHGPSILDDEHIYDENE